MAYANLTKNWADSDNNSDSPSHFRSQFNLASSGTPSYREMLSQLVQRTVTQYELCAVTGKNDPHAAAAVYTSTPEKPYELAAEITRKDRGHCIPANYDTINDYLSDFINRSANEALLQNRIATLKSADKLGAPTEMIELDKVKLYPIDTNGTFAPWKAFPLAHNLH